MPRPPWHAPTGLDGVVDGWLASGYVRPCLAADRTVPASAGAFEPLPDTLSPGIAAALRARGIERLYAHQARAPGAAGAGRRVVVPPPPARGKSLCFHLPVLDALAREPDASAIYLYPTKALARDQEAGLRKLIAESGLTIPAIVYDGDTPGD